MKQLITKHRLGLAWFEVIHMFMTFHRSAISSFLFRSCSSGPDRGRLSTLFFLHLGGPADGHAPRLRHAEEAPGENQDAPCQLHKLWLQGCCCCFFLNLQEMLSPVEPLNLSHLCSLQCTIDLKKNVLLIGTTGTETRFLSEAELPECARLAYGAEGRDETRPEEFADRELAEALQRSIQDGGKKYSHSFWLQPGFDWTFFSAQVKSHLHEPLEAS